ncbi:MAG: hypothetical protein ACYS91_20300 [Planctomycetota bacterium]
MIGQFFDGIMNQIEGLVLVLPLLGVIACTSTNLPTATEMPTVDKLPDIKKLPDPFLMNNGKRVKSKADWTKRRKEIKAMMLYYQYGHMPPAPKNLLKYYHLKLFMIALPLKNIFFFPWGPVRR